MVKELKAQVKCSNICSNVKYVGVFGIDTEKRDLKIHAMPPPRPEDLGE